MTATPALLAALIVFLAYPLSQAGASTGGSFAETLYASFQHPRCLTCHQFNSRRSQGLAYTTHRNRYLCDTCHQPVLTGLKGGEWQAPLARLDWTGLGPRETCELIKRNAGASEAMHRLSEHLMHDGRIRWALDSGMTPAGRYPTVDGGSAVWRREVLRWIEAGMRCE